MNSVTSQSNRRGTWRIVPLSIFLFGIGLSFSDAQLTNGVFDPSKVMVAKEKVKELQTFQQNIVMANEFNRTLGTPAHPRPHLENQEGGESTPGYGPPQVPDFDMNSTGKKRRGFLKKNQPSPFISPGAPIAEANKVGPSVEAIPIPESVERVAAPEAAPEATSPDMNTPSEGGPISVEVPGTDVAPGSGLLLDANSLEGGYITDGGVLLPSNSSSPDGRRTAQSSPSKLRKRFGLGKSKQVYDNPSRSIPISVGSGDNSGNPYSNENFVASSAYSPLLDGGADLETVRDMTESGALPLPTGATGIVERGSRKPSADTSQYYVVRTEDLVFEPFKAGTEEPDPDYAFNLYSGAVVKDLGLIGTKRKVQVDSGETGLVSKNGIRPLSIAEQSTMALGIEAGKPWYSILDTDPEL